MNNGVVPSINPRHCHTWTPSRDCWLKRRQGHHWGARWARNRTDCRLTHTLMLKIGQWISRLLHQFVGEIFPRVGEKCCPREHISFPQCHQLTNDAAGSRHIDGWESCCAGGRVCLQVIRVDVYYRALLSGHYHPTTPLAVATQLLNCQRTKGSCMCMWWCCRLRWGKSET